MKLSEKQITAVHQFGEWWDECDAKLIRGESAPSEGQRVALVMIALLGQIKGPTADPTEILGMLH
jgi:hypothetical protein